MSPPSSISFVDLFNAALEGYDKQTNTKLAEHPLAEKFEACKSVDSITSIFQEQTKIFGEFKDDRNIMGFLRPIVDVLFTLSNSTTLPRVLTLVVHTRSLIPVLCS